LFILWITLSAMPGPAQSPPAGRDISEIRLIVQGDDMGAAHGINVGTIQAYKEGILRATNVLVSAAWMPEAARMLKENPGLDVGIHLTLTSEWETVKWRPLTVAPSLVDAFGYFFRMVQPREGQPGISVAEAKPLVSEVEKELRAQIELGRKMVPQVSYISTHMGFGALSPDIASVVKKLAGEYHLAMAGPELGIERFPKAWEATDTPDVRAAKLAEKLGTIGPGTWLIVEHCATDTPETQVMGRNVAFDRSGVVAAWTNPKVIEAVKKRGIKLTSYKELITAGSNK
jgi:predicted glycoside hydrolase/deacetylase ChbG (UPF0249 family)